MFVSVQDLRSAFGFLPGVNVGPYAARDVWPRGQLLVATGTGSVREEHALLQRFGFGVDEVVTGEDPYQTASNGVVADKIRRLCRDGLQLRVFYVSDAEERFFSELGVPRDSILASPSAALTQELACKIRFHGVATALGLEEAVVPHRVCLTPDDLLVAHSELSQINGVLPTPDATIAKHGAWASGVGTGVLRSPEDVRAYANVEMNGHPILAEAAYDGIRDVSVQWMITDHGLVGPYLSCQVIVDQVEHAGNLVVSGDQLPGLADHDRHQLYTRARPFFEYARARGYRGDFGLDAIGIKTNGLAFYERDWRMIDPNPRRSASKYGHAVLRQLEARFGGRWAVMWCYIWPEKTFRSFSHLAWRLRHLLPDGDCGVIPFMGGLLPKKFAVMMFARVGEPYKTVDRLTGLLAQVRDAVDDPHTHAWN